MAKLDDQISTLQEKLKELKVRQQRIAARTEALNQQRERKSATRRKILIGGVVMTQIDQGAFDKKQLWDWLDQALGRPDDRALFDLPPR